MKVRLSRTPAGHAIGVLALLVACWFGLSAGVTDVSAGSVITWLRGGDINASAELVLASARLPRLVVALICGAALATAGGVMQCWTANALAGPGILGLNAGASAAMVLALVYFSGAGPATMILASIAGSATGGLLVMAFVRVIPAGTQMMRLILIGVMVSALLGSVTSTIVIANNMEHDILYWTVGGIGVVGWREVWWLASIAGIGFVVAALMSRDLALSALGIASARTLGVRASGLRAKVAISVVLLAGAANAIAGPVGFVGFLAPHLARPLVGPDPRRMLPLAALLGATLVVMADVCGRIVTAPDEQPLGLFLALIGAPALVVVALRSQRGSA